MAALEQALQYILDLGPELPSIARNRNRGRASGGVVGVFQQRDVVVPLSTHHRVPFRAVVAADMLSTKAVVDDGYRQRVRAQPFPATPAQTAVEILDSVGRRRQELVRPSIERM